MLSERKQFRKFRKFNKPLTTEDKIENFILRNSKNGFFTKVTTISHKFEITDGRTWEVIGELLTKGTIESTHDEKSGEMKLCQSGKIYSIMGSERKRKQTKQKFAKNPNNQKIRGKSQKDSSKKQK